MAASEWDMPDSFDRGGGNFLTEEGTFHLAVLDIDETPTDKNNNVLYGFKVSMEVLGGKNAGKTTDITMFAPDGDPSHEKGNNMARKKRAFFAKALCLVPDTVQPGQKVTVDLQQARGRQLKATLAFREKDGQKTKFLDFHYADIFHVDDPTCPPCEMSQAHLAANLYPAKLRRDPKSFESAKAKSNGSGPGNGNGSGHQQKQTAAVNLDDVV